MKSTICKVNALINKQQLKKFVLRLGDDALVMGHRLSQWCSNGPFLEEDLALTNVALDYVGRARMLYGYAAEIAADGSTEDSYAYNRDCRDFTNLLIHELPRGDFAFTMARQYLVDEFNLAYMEKLKQSTDQTLAAIAEKACKEDLYHLRRSTGWILRLGDGTAESHDRLQHAIDDLWGYTTEFFEMDELDQKIVQAGIGVDVAKLQPDWINRVTATLTDATLTVPTADWTVTGGRDGIHTEALGHMLSDLQFLQRAYPGQQW
jgi:ring-1,2-phenylacetyl-CoA epoxidase subunit PaaC